VAYIAAVEVDQRQRIVTSADKLKEMLGGSWTIEKTGKLASDILKRHIGVREIKIASGDVWLRADDLKDLTACLLAFRSKIVEDLDLPCSFAIVEEVDTPEASRTALSNEVQRVKHGKSGEIGHVSLPWFAACEIQPDRYANLWFPQWANDEQHGRRALVSKNSNARLNSGSETLSHYYDRFPVVKDNNLKKPRQMDDFAPANGSSYMALLRFDADNAGTIFNHLRLGTKCEDASWEPLRTCSKEFETCLRMALQQAFDGTIKEALRNGSLVKGEHFIPISPLIAAGDDFLIAIRKDLAVLFAVLLLDAYKQIAVSNETLNQLRVDPSPQKDLTLSGAVIFARSGFPFSVLSEMSNSVEKSAKRLRKQTGQTEPCLDVYWLESTGREEPIHSREESLTYQVGIEPNGAIYSLNTRPWTLSQAEAMRKGAELFAKHDIPRGKWHQLLAGLKDGEPLASAHYQRWLQHLTKGQRDCMEKVVIELLQPVGLWNNATKPWVETTAAGKLRNVTPLLELHQLREMLAHDIAAGGERQSQ